MCLKYVSFCMKLFGLNVSRFNNYEIQPIIKDLQSVPTNIYLFH